MTDEQLDYLEKLFAIAVREGELPPDEMAHVISAQRILVANIPAFIARIRQGEAAAYERGRLAGLAEAEGIKLLQTDDDYEKAKSAHREQVERVARKLT